MVVTMQLALTAFHMMGIKQLFTRVKGFSLLKRIRTITLEELQELATPITSTVQKQLMLLRQNECSTLLQNNRALGLILDEEVTEDDGVRSNTEEPCPW